MEVSPKPKPLLISLHDFPYINLSPSYLFPILHSIPNSFLFPFPSLIAPISSKTHTQFVIITNEPRQATNSRQCFRQHNGGGLFISRRVIPTQFLRRAPFPQVGPGDRQRRHNQHVHRRDPHSSPDGDRVRPDDRPGLQRCGLRGPSHSI